MGVAETIRHLAATEEEALLLRQIAEKAGRCARQNTPQWTRFLTEREQGLSEALMPLLGDPSRLYCGGDGAVRRILYFLPDWQVPPVPEEELPVGYVRCRYAAEYGTVTHRDLLGALMGLGISRDSVGDLYLSEGSADAAVLRELVPFVCTELASAGRVRLAVEEIRGEEVQRPEEKMELRRDTVASLRLDSVVSSAFGMAREKAAALIRTGRVQLDGLECLKPDRIVEEGVSITARGFGKAVLREAGALSRKGRVCIVLARYL